MDKTQILEVLKENLGFLVSRYHVKTIGLFGSFVRDEASETSDVDILVEFSMPITLFEFINLEDLLSDIIGRKVDLVTKSGLKPLIKPHVLEDVLYVQ
ncbi:MAG: nucleotidyltransferase family protein [Promethearchaeota archaeon]